MTRHRHFRSSPRPPVTLQVTLKHPNSPDKENQIVTTRDVSTGGLFVFTNAPYDIDDLVEVDLTTPSTWEPLCLRAKVCRIVSAEEGTPGIGLKFVDIDDAELVALINLISSLDFES